MSAPADGVLITRPAEDAGPLMAAVAARGHRPIAAPALAIARVGRAGADDLAGAGRVLFTSRRAVGFAAEGWALSPPVDLPAFAVGAQTAEAARAAGFARVVEGAAGAAALAAPLRAEAAADPTRPSLIYRGEDVAVDLGGALRAAGLPVAERVLYAARPTPLTQEARFEILSGDVGKALFLSARTVSAFRDAAAGLDMSGIEAVCNSARTAAAAEGAGFRRVATAAAPTVDAMLALL